MKKINIIIILIVFSIPILSNSLCNIKSDIPSEQSKLQQPPTALVAVQWGKRHLECKAGFGICKVSTNLLWSNQRRANKDIIPIITSAILEQREGNIYLKIKREIVNKFELLSNHLIDKKYVYFEEAVPIPSDVMYKLELRSIYTINPGKYRLTEDNGYIIIHFYN